jgi:hypothetical protein
VRTEACSAERLSREKLDAVLVQLAGIYRDAPAIAREQAREEQPSLDKRRRSIKADRAHRAIERA